MAFYRRTGRSWTARLLGADVLFLTTSGRRSDRRRDVLVAYTDGSGGALLVAAGNSGFRHLPGWYHNMRSGSCLQVQIGHERTARRRTTCRARTGSRRTRVFWTAIPSSTASSSCPAATYRW